MDLVDLTLATFEPLVGDGFAVQTGAGDGAPVELVLESATTSGEWPGGRDPFALVFRGPPDPLLPQATYGLRHPGLGLCEIFIVPIAKNADGVAYQAIFT